MIDPLNNDGCILITGAGSGIGQTTALQLNMMGVKTVLVGRKQSKLEATAAMLENRDLAYIYPRDLGEDPDGTTKWMQTIVAETGPLSGLVCLAGEQMIAQVGGVKAAQVQTLFTNNIFSSLFLAQAFADRRINAGAGSAIVFVASVSTRQGEKGLAFYAAGKSALLGFMKSFAKEIAARGLRVNTVTPGLVKTPMIQNQSKVYTAAFLREHEAAYPLGGWRTGKCQRCNCVSAVGEKQLDDGQRTDRRRRISRLILFAYNTDCFKRFGKGKTDLNAALFGEATN